MPHLESLVARLRAEQRELIREAEDWGPVPSPPLLKRIADLESAIRSVEALIEDR